MLHAESIRGAWRVRVSSAIVCCVLAAGCHESDPVSSQTPHEERPPANATASLEPIAIDTPCVVLTALGEVGVKEDGCANCGPKVEAYLSSVHLPKGYPWCAAYCHFCLRHCGIVLTPERKFAAAAQFSTAHEVFRKGQLEDYEPLGPGHDWERISEDGDCFTLWYKSLNRVGHVGFIVGEDEKYVITVEGNGLPLTAMIVTPSGMRAISDINVGDAISDPFGSPSIVTGVFPQGVRPTYEVLFSDGTRIISDENHRWLFHVGGKRDSPQRVMTTKEAADYLARTTGSKRMYLPSILPVEFNQGVRLPIDPYLLGALIGDGGFSRPSSVHFTSVDDQILGMVRDRLPITCSMTHIANNDYRIRGKYMLKLMRQLGLQGHRSESKFIPDAYKLSSVSDRKELLRGLLDTDGTVDKQGRISFASASRRLSEDVQFIVQSLGGKAAIYHKKNIMYTSPKQLTPKAARDSFIVMNIRFPESIDFSPFALDRKMARVSARERRSMQGWSVVSVTPCGAEETVCISVSAPSRLYMTDHFIPTHNTSEDGSREGTTVRKRKRLKATLYSVNRWIDG